MDYDDDTDDGEPTLFTEEDLDAAATEAAEAASRAAYAKGLVAGKRVQREETLGLLEFATTLNGSGTATVAALRKAWTPAQSARHPRAEHGHFGHAEHAEDAEIADLESKLREHHATRAGELEHKAAAARASIAEELAAGTPESDPLIRTTRALLATIERLARERRLLAAGQTPDASWLDELPQTKALPTDPPDADDDADDTDLHTPSDDDLAHELLLHATEYARDRAHAGGDAQPVLDALAQLAGDPHELRRVLEGETVAKGFDPSEKRDEKGEWTAGAGDGDGETEVDDEPQDTDPNGLVGINETIPEKVDALAANMRENGWQGPPLLAVNGHLLTGTHRAEAAARAGLDAVPVVHLDADRFVRAAAAVGALRNGADRDEPTWEDVRVPDDETRLALVKKMGYRQGDAPFDILSDELDNNSAYGGESWSRADWVAIKAFVAEAPAHLRGVLAALIQKAVAWDSNKHPRSDDGRFVSVDAIHRAKSDPKLAKQLRNRVTDPDERKKLEDALSGKSEIGHTAASQKRADAAAKREKVTADRDAARAIRDRLFAQHQAGAPLHADDLRALVPHLSTMSHAELSTLRTFLGGAGAHFGGETRLAERRARVLAWAHAKAEETDPTKKLSDKPKGPKRRGKVDSVLQAVVDGGGIDPESHDFLRNYESMRRATQDGIPMAAFRTGGQGLDTLAEQLQRSGLISVPDHQDAGTYVLDQLRDHAYTLAADLTEAYDRAHEEYARALEEARNDHSAAEVEAAARRGAQAGARSGAEDPLGEHGEGADAEPGDADAVGDFDPSHFEAPEPEEGASDFNPLDLSDEDFGRWIAAGRPANGLPNPAVADDPQGASAESAVTKKLKIGGRVRDVTFNADGSDRIEDDGNTRIVTYTRDGVKSGYLSRRKPDGSYSQVDAFQVREQVRPPDPEPEPEPAQPDDRQQFAADHEKRVRSLTKKLLKQNDLTATPITHREARRRAEAQVLRGYAEKTGAREAVGAKGELLDKPPPGGWKESDKVGGPRATKDGYVASQHDDSDPDNNPIPLDKRLPDGRTLGEVQEARREGFRQEYGSDSLNPLKTPRDKYAAANWQYSLIDLMHRPDILGKKERDEEIEHYRDAHARAVKDALAAGKPVPPEVLADYPDLAPAAALDGHPGALVGAATDPARPLDARLTALADLDTATLDHAQRVGSIGGNEYGRVLEQAHQLLQTRKPLSDKPTKLELSNDKKLTEQVKLRADAAVARMHEHLLPGLRKLHADGTPVLDDEGRPVGAHLGALADAYERTLPRLAHELKTAADAPAPTAKPVAAPPEADDGLTLDFGAAAPAEAKPAAASQDELAKRITARRKQRQTAESVSEHAAPTEAEFAAASGAGKVASPAAHLAGDELAAHRNSLIAAATKPIKGHGMKASLKRFAINTVFAHPEAARHVPPGSKFLGAGLEAIAFRTPQGDVVRLEPDRGARPAIPEVLQPTAAQVLGSGDGAVRVERLPFAQKVPADQVAAATADLHAKLAVRGYIWTDDKPANIGLVGGEYKIIDPGNIARRPPPV